MIIFEYIFWDHKLEYRTGRSEWALSSCFEKLLKLGFIVFPAAGVDLGQCLLFLRWISLCSIIDDWWMIGSAWGKFLILGYININFIWLEVTFSLILTTSDSSGTVQNVSMQCIVFITKSVEDFNFSNSVPPHYFPSVCSYFLSVLHFLVFILHFFSLLSSTFLSSPWARVSDIYTGRLRSAE